MTESPKRWRWRWYSTLAVIILIAAIAFFVYLLTVVIGSKLNPALLFLIGVPLIGFGGIIIGRIVTNQRHDDG